MVHALAALAGYALSSAGWSRRGSHLMVAVFALLILLAVLAGIMLGDTFVSLWWAKQRPMHKAFDYLPVFWESAWSGFTDHWINGVGIRGWGSMVVSMESITVLPVSERWHPICTLWRSVDTGVPGLIGYGLFFIFLGRRLFDAVQK